MLILFGFLLQWPTLLTLAMFPILVTMYARLALREEHEAMKQFGDDYARYAARVPRFFPQLRGGKGGEAGRQADSGGMGH